MTHPKLGKINLAAILKMIEELIAALSGGHPLPGPADFTRNLKAAKECCTEDACCELLKCQAKIMDDAVYFHGKTHSDTNATDEDKARAECLLACAAHGMLFAVKIHQEEYRNELEPTTEPEPEPESKLKPGTGMDKAH